MNIQTISNTRDCSGKGVIGTGLNYCPFDLSDMSGSGQIHLYKRGFKHTETDFTKDYLQGLQQAGNLIVLKGVFSVESNSSENQVETSSGGIERLATEGKYKWTFTFTNGMEFNRALSYLQSYGRYDLALSDGYNEVHHASKSGNHGGFTIGQIQVNRYTGASGGTSAKSSISIQLTDTRQYDQEFAYISGDQLEDFSFAELDGINQINTTITNAPSSTGTSVQFNAVSSADKTTALSGLEVADVVVKVNGTAVTVSSLTEGTDGSYDATVPALATDDVVEVSLDGVIIKDGFLYQSYTDKVVVTA